MREFRERSVSRPPLDKVVQAHRTIPAKLRIPSRLLAESIPLARTLVPAPKYFADPLSPSPVSDITSLSGDPPEKKGNRKKWQAPPTPMEFPRKPLLHVAGRVLRARPAQSRKSKKAKAKKRRTASLCVSVIAKPSMKCAFSCHRSDAASESLRRQTFRFLL